jgi:hypothetical protein
VCLLWRLRDWLLATCESLLTGPPDGGSSGPGAGPQAPASCVGIGSGPLPPFFSGTSSIRAVGCGRPAASGDPSDASDALSWLLLPPSLEELTTLAALDAELAPGELAVPTPDEECAAALDTRRDRGCGS